MPNEQETGERREFGEAGCLAAGLDTLGYDAPRSAGVMTLTPHFHAGAFEVCLILDGVVEWWAQDEEQIYRVGPGEVYLTRPGEWHGGVNATIQPSRFYWLITPLRDGPASMSRRDRAAARRALAAAPRRFPASTRLIDLIRQLHAEHTDPRSALRRAAAEALFQLLIVQLVRDAEQAETHRKTVSREVLAAQRWMLDRLDQSLGLEGAADAAGLSVTRLHERFRAETGLSPAEWRNRRRLDLARRQLADSDLSIINIAMRCGFNTSQYFATAFKKHVGLTPSAYRQQVQPGEQPTTHR